MTEGDPRSSSTGRTALLVTDLEGVAGVDDLDGLVAGTMAYRRGRQRLEAEVAAAVEGLVTAGFGRVVVSDSHRGGGAEPNLRAVELPPAAILDFRRDAYDEALFADVAAVACLGMHAPAGGAGFAAHTVEVTGAWRNEGRLLSESDIVLGLAAERGVPIIFIAGDDALEEHLGGVAPYVRVKRSLSVASAASRAPDAVHDALRRAAELPPIDARRLSGELGLDFKSGWQAELAERLGAERTGSRSVRVPGATFRERYARALELVYATGPVLGQAVRSFDARALREDLRGLLLRRHDQLAPAAGEMADGARRALAAFLAATAGSASWQRADRALTLHMLESHAPGFFAAEALAPALDAAVAALAAVPADFPAGLFPPEAMARLDAIYVARERGLAAPLDGPALSRYVQDIASAHGLFAWLIGAEAALVGGPTPHSFPPRPFRARSRLADLYWLTHLVLLDTRFLRRPLDASLWAAEIEEMFLAVPWVGAERHLDIAAELAFCLEAAGETATGETRALLALLAAHQADDGRILVAGGAGEGDDAPRVAAHASAAAAIAFAGATR